MDKCGCLFYVLFDYYLSILILHHKFFKLFNFLEKVEINQLKKVEVPTHSDGLQPDLRSYEGSTSSYDKVTTFVESP